MVSQYGDCSASPACASALVWSGDTLPAISHAKLRGLICGRYGLSSEHTDAGAYLEMFACVLMLIFARRGSNGNLCKGG
ncbi:hypothetical protein DPMN_112269 [Dreissena polymorpha]|uniref:Uncharacterized protein n=1 Tax=Dreissena polymorpha TaxID=45954 RepID=A0A9D4KFD9_DREPO|nr:hypothetical protein DPMN_112269 [Dreissena polymorpha]